MVAEKKTHFPQVPLEEVKQMMARQAACRRPANVVQQRKKSDPYSIPVASEGKIGGRTLENKK